ncbi:MAG: hypothetical protein IJ806_04535 [Ruminococcus sp.]|nr:hypothetical protein [Ruminococcus sp.]
MTDNDNKALGVVGAVIGAGLGMLVWLLLARLGVIAAIGGFAIAGGAFYGYFLLAKGISKTGLVIVAVVALVTVYLSIRLSYAFLVQRTFEGDLTLKESFALLEVAMSDPEVKGAYIKDMLMGYAFTLIGGFSVIKKALV